MDTKFRAVGMADKWELRGEEREREEIGSFVCGGDLKRHRKNDFQLLMVFILTLNAEKVPNGIQARKRMMVFLLSVLSVGEITDPRVALKAWNRFRKKAVWWWFVREVN